MWGRLLKEEGRPRFSLLRRGLKRGCSSEMRDQKGGGKRARRRYNFRFKIRLDLKLLESEKSGRGCCDVQQSAQRVRNALGRKSATNQGGK